MNYWTQGPDNIYVAAHRGWSAKYPENTMEAFRAAVELGVDQIETDVRVTKDGKLVLIHDAALDRTTDHTGNVIDYTLEELKKVDAGVKKGPEFAGCRIPELYELLELVKDHPTMTLDIELKEYPTEGREELSYDVCGRTIELLEQYGYGDRCVINTFSGKLHEYIFKKYGKKYRQHIYFPFSYLGETTMHPLLYGYCICMFGSPYMAEKSDFDMVRAHGVRPWAGAGVKDAAGVDNAIANGAELITCNNPDDILALLRERGCHR